MRHPRARRAEPRKSSQEITLYMLYGTLFTVNGAYSFKSCDTFHKNIPTAEKITRERAVESCKQRLWRRVRHSIRHAAAGEIGASFGRAGREAVKYCVSPATGAGPRTFIELMETTTRAKTEKTLKL